jgi:two-component sensor histidine kinase
MAATSGMDMRAFYYPAAAGRGQGCRQRRAPATVRAGILRFVAPASPGGARCVTMPPIAINLGAPAMNIPSATRACGNGIDSHPLLVIPFFRRFRPSLARDLVYTLIWSSLLALALTLIGLLFTDRAGFFEVLWPNFVFAQCIGYLIHFAFALGHRWWPGIAARGPVLKMAYYTGLPLLCVFVGMWIASGLVGGAPVRHWLAQPRNITVISGVSLVLSCILLLIYIPRERAARAEAAVARESARVAAAERAAALAQMKLLEAQVEPHFLYNTLAHVDSAIESDPQAARRMLARLVALLRAAAAAATESATLASQVAWTRAYLELVEMRMGRRLAWTIDVEPGLDRVVLPPAILQPLVENAVKHGLEPRIDGGTIAIAARRAGDAVEVSVADTGEGFRATRDPARSTGIGLANLRARLALLYGDGATMTIADNAPRGARVALTLPLQDAGLPRAPAAATASLAVRSTERRPATAGRTVS